MNFEVPVQYRNCRHVAIKMRRTRTGELQEASARRARLRKADPMPIGIPLPHGYPMDSPRRAEATGNHGLTYLIGICMGWSRVDKVK